MGGNIVAKYIFMNRNQEVARLDLNTELETGYIKEFEIINIGHLPFPVRYCEEGLQTQILENWFSRRLLSSHRNHLEQILRKTKANRLQSSLLSYGLTLMDGYWLKPEGDRSLTWDQVNFFENEFSYDIGNMIFGLDRGQPDFMTPDLTTNGKMEKTWRRRDGKLWLLKKGAPPYFEEPFNEKIVTEILKRIAKVPFVSYEVNFVRRHAVSVCENFAKEDIQFVSAADLIKTSPRPSFIPLDAHLRNRCQYFKIPGYKIFFDQLKLLDYLIGNQDRHLGNYGFLYDSEQEKFLGPAPIFDNGSSLWCQEPEEKLYEPINLARQQAKRTLEYIRKPYEFQLTQEDVLWMKNLVNAVYSEYGIYNDRASKIGTMMSQRCQVMGQYLERELEQKEIQNQRQFRIEQTQEADFLRGGH